MTVKDIIGDCIFKLGHAERISMADDAVYTEEEQKILDALLRAANIVYAEICTNWFLNVVTETVTFTDAKLQLSDLTNTRFVYAVSLKHGGTYRKIKQYPSYIKSDFSGEAELEFVAVPDTLLMTTVIDGRVPAWLFSDGVVGEYAFSNNMLDAAVQYERRFREGLSRLKGHGAGRYLKPRRWL
jgi:hypothetical protein